MRAALLMAALLTGALLTAAPASAAPRLQVSPGSGLPRGGATVTVTGSGYDPDGVGIYVAWCKVVPQYWTSADNCADARWVHTGGAGAGQAPMSPAGTFSVQLTISPTIGDTSCLTAGRCSVLTMAAHGSSDRSQDAFASVGFAAALQPSSKRAAPHSTTPRSSAARPSTPASSTPRSTTPTKTVATTATTKPRLASAPATSLPASEPPAPTPSAAVMAAAQARTGGGTDGGSSGAGWLAVGFAAAVAAGAAVVLLLRRRPAR